MVQLTGVALLPSRKQPWFGQDLVPAFAVLALSLGAFVLAAPLDPDPHHDGYQFTLALALTEGLAPHVGAFSQYGPVTALLHSLALTTVGPTVLSLRLLTAVMLSAIAVTGFVIARFTGLGRGVSFLLSVLWVALAPPWGVFADALPLWPWPSVLFTLVAQGVVLVLMIALRKPHLGWLWLLAGVLLAVSTTIRVNQGLPLVIAVVLALLLPPQSRVALRSNIGTFAGGFVAATLVFLGYLVLASSPSGFVNDAIAGATSVYLVEGFDETARVFAPVSPLQILTYSFILASVPLFLAAFAMRWALKSRSAPRSLTILSAGLVALALLLTAALGYYGRFRDTVGTPVETVLGLSGLNALGSAPLYAAWMGVFIVFGRTMIQWTSNRDWPMPFAPTLALFAAGAFTTQVIPRWDVYHLWWAGPLLMIVTFSALSRGLTDWRPIVLAGVVTIPYLIPAAYSAWNHLSSPRETIQTGALAGMKTPSERAQMVGSISDALSVITPRSARFLCDDALMAAFNARYLADSADYVQWGWSRGGVPDVSPTFIVTCSDNPDAESEDFQWMGTGYSLIRGPVSMNLSPWSQTQLRIYSRTEL